MEIIDLQKKEDGSYDYEFTITRRVGVKEDALLARKASLSKELEKIDNILAEINKVKLEEVIS